MPASIGVNLRVTGHCRQGGRKYMEDFFSVAYQQTEDEKDLEYAFFGIYDGHGGAEAAAYAKEHLMETIIRHKNFWSDYDEDVLRAIKDGYIATHYAMWKEQEKWPKTASGLPSTAGTTASVAFIRRGKIYIGHVGDSGIILGYQEPGSVEWKAKPLTRDHKPENADEMSRIEKCGGKVVSKSGVPRVVWNRPRIGHQGPVRRSTPIDEIPFLAVARSLGDLWSYNSQIDRFIVSPQPDCLVIPIDTDVHRCLIFGTDGLYNMLSPILAVHIVQHAERHNENAALSDSTYKTWLNPSKLLVEKALDRWHTTKMRADNTSAVTLMLDPPGPPRAQVLKDRKKNLPERGLKIMTRFDGNAQDSPSPNNNNNCDSPVPTTPESAVVDPQAAAGTLLESEESEPALPPVFTEIEVYPSTTKEVDGGGDCLRSGGEFDNETPVSSSDLNTLLDSNQLLPTCQPLKERNHLSKKPLLRESTSFDPRVSAPDLPQTPDDGKENKRSCSSPIPSISSSTTSLIRDDPIIQCNEVSSSNIELEGSCEEAVDHKTEKRSGNRESRILRSHGKDIGKVENNRKRKLQLEESFTQPRKSLRLESSQGKTVVPTQKRLRKPANSEEKRNLTSFAQKLLKCKTVSLKKKKSIVQQPVLTKKKIQLVVQKVKKEKKEEKPMKVKKKPDKATKKIVTTKVAFLRRSKNTGSQRSKEKSKQCKSDDVKMKHNAKDDKVPKKQVAVKRSSSSSKVPSSQKSLRVGNVVPVKEVPSLSSRKSSPSNKAATKRSDHARTITLKKRLQQKTERLRKNVMHK